MRRAALFTFLIFSFFFAAQGQTHYFEMPIYFEDGAGNRDTVIVGYSDTAALKGCNQPFLLPEYGEFNEAEIPWDETFEVRANKTFFCTPTLFHVLGHKAIDYMDGDCDSFFGGQAGTIHLITKVKHLPVTVSWDTTALNTPGNYCRNGAIIDRTPHWSFYPDIPFPEETVTRMNLKTGFVDSFHINLVSGNPNNIPTWATTKQNGQTVDTFRLYELHFGNNWWLPPPTSTKDISEIPVYLYPNPASSQISIAGMDGVSFQAAGIFDLTGARVKAVDLEGTDGDPKIDIGYLSPGFYTLLVKTKGGGFMKGKFVKQ